MNNYKEFRPVDFAADVDFIRWIRSPESYPDNTRFWSQWLESNPEKEADVLEAEKLVALFGYPDDVAAHRATLWDRIDTSLEASEATGKQIKMAEKAFNWNALVRYAAVFIIVLTVGAFWYLNKNERPLATMAAKATVYQNINENPKTILLEDGTSVILYQKTRLKIHPEFNVNERKVEVEGKAYFEVLRDEQRPFFVMAQGVTTRVLGTSFLVTAYSQQDITVAVNTGEVSVSRQQHGATAREMIVLTENEAASFTHQTQELTKMDPEEITLNQDFYKADFHFENRPLSQVFELIENRYGVDISYNETKIEQCMLNASLVGIPLEDKIRLICKTSNLSYTINRDKIVIKGEGCEIL